MSCRPISSTYLKPAVVTSAVGGVLPSRIALVAVVVPWKTRSTSAGGGAGKGQPLARGGDEAGGEVAGRRRRLRHPERAGGGVGERDVGEGPAHIDGER